MFFRQQGFKMNTIKPLVPKEIESNIKKYLDWIFADSESELTKEEFEESIRYEIECYQKYTSIKNKSDLPEQIKSDIENIFIECNSSNYQGVNIFSWQDLYELAESDYKAYKALSEFKDNEIPEVLFKSWVEQEFEDGWYCIEYSSNTIMEKVSAYKEDLAIRRKIDPIKKLLIDLESIVAKNCYNEGIGNYIRYPIKYINKEHYEVKTETPHALHSEQLLRSYYSFGANRLEIYKALKEIIEYLEINHGLCLRAK